MQVKHTPFPKHKQGTTGRKQWRDDDDDNGVHFTALGLKEPRWNRIACHSATHAALTSRLAGAV